MTETTETTPTPAAPQRHPFNPWSLVAGLVFLAISVGFIAHDHDLVTTDQLAIVAPVVLIVLGIGGIALTLRRNS